MHTRSYKEHFDSAKLIRYMETNVMKNLNWKLNVKIDLKRIEMRRKF